MQIEINGDCNQCQVISCFVYSLIIDTLLVRWVTFLKQNLLLQLQWLNMNHWFLDYIHKLALVWFLWVPETPYSLILVITW